MYVWKHFGVLHLGRGEFVRNGQEVPAERLTTDALLSLKKKGKVIEVQEVIVVDPQPENKVVEEKQDEEKEAESFATIKGKPLKIKKDK